MEDGRPLTTGQIAKHCYVSRSTVLKWIKEGSLRAYTMPGGFHRIERADFAQFLREHGMPMRADFFSNDPEEQTLEKNTGRTR